MTLEQRVNTLLNYEYLKKNFENTEINLVKARLSVLENKNNRGTYIEKKKRKGCQ